MTVEINSVEINEETIILEGTNLDKIFLSDDLYEELDQEPVKFVFNRHDHSGSALKYLYKVCSSQKSCQQANSMGKKIEKLVGCIILLNESFIEK